MLFTRYRRAVSSAFTAYLTCDGKQLLGFVTCIMKEPMIVRGQTIC